MAYEYEGKLLDYASDSKTYEEYKAIRNSQISKKIIKRNEDEGMANTITVDQLKELLQIQKDFDSRIPTLNLQDSKVAYVVEFFEWFNTLETFKNWKKNPGKPLDVQLDELADMLAFGLSIANQSDVKINDMDTINGYLNNVQEKPVKLNEIWDFHDVYD